MMYRKITISIAVFALALPLLVMPVFAAQSGTIKGRVADAQSGDALPGASVYLVGTSLGASTSLNGSYTITNVPPGTYTVRTTYIGYKTNVLHIRVAPGATLEEEIRLKAVGVQGKEVVVTASAVL